MIVVSDATPLIVLIRIECESILPNLFGSVITTPTVVREMSHANPPASVRAWIAAAPGWLVIRAPVSIDASMGIDPGEREAISLALELRA
ncbi:MAG: hypothetical protein ACKVS9_08300 [Phycisphaerae bacterium]